MVSWHPCAHTRRLRQEREFKEQLQRQAPAGQQNTTCQCVGVCGSVCASSWPIKDSLWWIRAGMFVSCMFVNVCVKRNGNRKEGGREERAERDTCSDREKRWKREGKKEPGVHPQHRPPPALSVLPSSLWGVEWGGAVPGGSHPYPLPPAPIASVGFMARLERVRDRWSQAGGRWGLSLWGSVCAPSGPSRRAWAGSLELHLGVQSALSHQACFL